MLTSIGKVCLIAVTISLASVQGLKFYCEPDDTKCTIESWNPSVDGYFLLQHVPNVTKKIDFTNLQSLHVGSELCNTIARVVDSLLIYDSPRVRIVFIPTTCNILTLAIHHTGLRCVSFEANDNLKAVLIKDIPLRKVPAELINLPRVEYILLEETRIAYVDLNLFYPLEHLKLLKITHGNVKHLRGNSKMICNTALDSLKLDRNSLRAVNLNLFAPFTSLTLLALSHNKIATLSGQLSNPKLGSILLNHNRLKVFDLCAWNTLPQLNALTVAYNYMTRMPHCLERFRNVAHISMECNQINNIETEQMIHLPNLISINLSFNRISSIPVNESCYPAKLQQLDLCGNPIGNVTIPDGLIGHVEVSLDKR